jgi:G3E family GTPase
MLNKIPVTILTGFLGSGKTTLLNRIIEDNLNKKIIVIENEFGEIGIDKALVLNVDTKVFELSNGCICCNLNDDLLAVLTQLIDNEETIDHLIIETTGIADPGPIALNFISDENIQQYFKLDSIITLVDSQFVEQQLEQHDEAVKQIALADVILINKSDRVEVYQVDVVKNIVARINDQAKVLVAEFGKVGSIDLLNINAFEANVVLNSAFYKSKKDTSTSQFRLSSKDYNFESLLLTTPKHKTVNSHSFIIKEPLDFMRFDMWVNMMLNVSVDSIYRMKGVLYIQDFENKLIFQSVYNQYVCVSGGLWKDDEIKESSLVIIGKNLNREILKNGLDQLK